jgi:hypothetical protein
MKSCLFFVGGGDMYNSGTNLSYNDVTLRPISFIRGTLAIGTNATAGTETIEGNGFVMAYVLEAGTALGTVNTVRLYLNSRNAEMGTFTLFDSGTKAIPGTNVGTVERPLYGTLDAVIALSGTHTGTTSLNSFYTLFYKKF